MFTNNLAEFKIKQKELHQQADNYRLVKSVLQPKTLVSQFFLLLAK